MSTLFLVVIVNTILANAVVLHKNTTITGYSYNNRQWQECVFSVATAGVILLFWGGYSTAALAIPVNNDSLKKQYLRLVIKEFIPVAKIA